MRQTFGFVLLLASLVLPGCGSDSSDSTTGPSTPLTIEDLVVGTGATAVAGDVLTVAYVGRFTNGQIFEQNTYQFQLGAGRVIAGWDQGIPGMKVGGRRRLTIPPELAYGSQGAGGGVIPPNSTLIFEVELVSIVGK